MPTGDDAIDSLDEWMICKVDVIGSAVTVDDGRQVDALCIDSDTAAAGINLFMLLLLL